MHKITKQNKKPFDGKKNRLTSQFKSLQFLTKHSMQSKRFRGVFCTKKPIYVFLDACEIGRERKHGGGGQWLASKNKEIGFLAKKTPRKRLSCFAD